jgi:hypothetical protein
MSFEEAEWGGNGQIGEKTVDNPGHNKRNSPQSSQRAQREKWVERRKSERFDFSLRTP